MAKRFTDTDKYQKPFIRGLKGPYKLLWDYICLNCNHAGIWVVELDVAQKRIGEDMPISKTGALEAFGNKIKVIDNGERWFIPSFIEYQYGELNPKNRVHGSVLRELIKYNLESYISPLQAPSEGAKDKEKDKDKDKDKDGGGSAEELAALFVRTSEYGANRNFDFLTMDFTRLLEKYRPEAIRLAIERAGPRAESVGLVKKILADDSVRQKRASAADAEAQWSANETQKMLAKEKADYEAKKLSEEQTAIASKDTSRKKRTGIGLETINVKPDDPNDAGEKKSILVHSGEFLEDAELQAERIAANG